MDVRKDDINQVCEAADDEIYEAVDRIIGHLADANALCESIAGKKCPNRRDGLCAVFEQHCFEQCGDRGAANWLKSERDYWKERAERSEETIKKIAAIAEQLKGG